MHKKLLIIAWLLIPVALMAYHYGPGQKGIARDQAADKITAAQQAEKEEDWQAAMDAYDEALKSLPADDNSTRYKLRLARATARIYSGQLPEAMGDLDTLLTEMQKANADAKQIREVRAELASAQYYAAWLMRLEGATTEEWTAQVDNSRQNFRLLAEETKKAGDEAGALNHRKDLESAIRLARMDLSELQALPLPKKCQGCKNCSQKCRSQSASKCENPGEKKELKDARGAGAGKRPDNAGS